MEIGNDVAVGFDGSVWGNWEEEENPLSKKASSLTAMVKSAIEMNEWYVTAARVDSNQFSRNTDILAVGGSWSTSISGSTDTQGNSKATVEGSVGAKTDGGGVEISASAGASVSTDQNQNVKGDAHGSVTISGHF